jgi:hypothetical protein
MEKSKTFNELSTSNKELLIDDLGIHLCSIEFYDHRIHLYALNNMFIEVFHNIETREVEKILSVDYGQLDKYTMRITLGPMTIKAKSN